MRLTLRTLLAYMDNCSPYREDILEPADAEQLRQKIEDSDFAQGLEQRIRSATARSRLGAPATDGKGMGLDPNTVAEYLDNLLPPDRVPDLERICLESDMHLAEVASCHQILAIVLGEPAQVDPDLRGRMYLLGAPQTDRRAAAAMPPADMNVADSSDSLAAPPRAGEAFDPPPVWVPPPVEPAAGATVEPARRPKSEVPEYLRAGQRSSWKPMLITLMLAFLLSAVALRAMGPFDRSHPLLRLMGGGSGAQIAEVDESSPPPTAENDSGEAGETSVDDLPEPEPADSDRENAVDDHAAIEPEETDTSPSVDAGVGTAEPRGKSAAERGADGASLPKSEPEEPAADRPEVEFPSTAPSVDTIPGRTAADGGESIPAETTAPAGSTKPGSPEVPVEVGYVKMKDLHFPVRLDPATRDWYRLPGRSKLFSADHLRVLPTFRPEIVLAPGVQVVFAGPSSAHLTPPTPTGEPTLLMEYGRAFVATAGVPGARLNLHLGGGLCVVTFVDAASEVALEVRDFLPVGANPESDARQQIVRVFTTIGRIEWQDDQQAVPVPVAEGQVRIIVNGNAETVAAGDLPAWILREDLRDIDRVASSELENHLVVDRPVTLSLKEYAQHRRTENRSLAARSLSYLDSFEALVAEFDDPRQRAHWAVEFDALRSAISRSPESASAVREALENLYPHAAREAYRLLSGYSPQQLQEGADEILVGMLDHESLCIRVLASENLRRITGMTLSYFPYVSEEQRRASVREWRKRLENRSILYDTLPVSTSDRW